jgi:ADP-ribosylglycohydrolase
VTEKEVLSALRKSQGCTPEGIDGSLKGWVLIAFQLAFYTVLHAKNFEKGMIELTMRAGEADTNAAIYGALGGAFAGAAASLIAGSRHSN